jgi:hypothetical protein
MIAQAADRHRDLACRLGLHRLVRYPRAIGVDGIGQCVTDDTYCQVCHRLIRRRVVARFAHGDRRPHLLKPFGVDNRRGSTKIPPRE